MSKAVTAAHEPTIHYLDSVLSEEEKRCDYNHQWRNFSISRSGRFRSKVKKRDAVDCKLFDAGSPQEKEKISSRCLLNGLPPTKGPMTAPGTHTRSEREHTENFKSFYETNL
ncbi:uncharacterized protein LOC108115022 [Drosophila eugracilis]|uniref:uncharacterized protein LOC108115022 n=1 Tax=Drosophila eugracilis TaxID=29029 RepID=UPI0007E7FF67|nr:uncharacterized protein LOC108115022 [Drosophila eugracilis]XP_017081754.1 uncharacterized protein LOC108115022 [Drosophila eugracilis]